MNADFIIFRCSRIKLIIIIQYVLNIIWYATFILMFSFFLKNWRTAHFVVTHQYLRINFQRLFTINCLQSSEILQKKKQNSKLPNAIILILLCKRTKEKSIRTLYMIVISISVTCVHFHEQIFHISIKWNCFGVFRKKFLGVEHIIESCN
jgi:hypothetical protein